MKEHRFIEKVLGSLEAFSDQLEPDQQDARQLVPKYAEFFREFADRCHHGKEEDRLFTALGRNHLRRVAHYLESAAGGDPASLAEVAENMLEAEKTLRAEIELDDTQLLPLLRPLDADRACDDVTRELEEIDRRQRKALPHITCRRIASVLWA